MNAQDCTLRTLPARHFRSADIFADHNRPNETVELMMEVMPAEEEVPPGLRQEQVGLPTQSFVTPEAC
jgi:hypothetical protein